MRGGGRVSQEAFFRPAQISHSELDPGGHQATLAVYGPKTTNLAMFPLRPFNRMNFKEGRRGPVTDINGFYAYKLGNGLSHNNCEAEEQASMVHKVKKFRNGFIPDPITLAPNSTIRDVDKLVEEMHFTGFPVTEDGKLGSKLLGLVTSKETDFLSDRNMPLKDVMVSQNLITGRDGISLQEANEIMRTKKIGKLPPSLQADSMSIVLLPQRNDLLMMSL